MSTEDRYIKPQELARPVFEAFWSQLETVNALPGSKLGKAVTYALNQSRTWRTISLMADFRCQTMQLRMLSDHLLSAAKTGYLLTVLRGLLHQLACTG